MRRRDIRSALLKLGGIAAVFALFAIARCIAGPWGAALAAPVQAKQRDTSTIAPVSPAAPKSPAIPFSGELTQGGWIRGVAPPGTAQLQLDGENVRIAPDGSWFAAFDRDAAARGTLTARLLNGATLSQDLIVAPRDWLIEHVNIARRPGGPTEAFMRIRQPELERIDAARAMPTDAKGWRQRFIWPARGRISGRFGSQRIYRGEPGSYHSGIDITTGRSGTPFVAPADGVVILAANEPFTLEGNLLMLDHGMGLNSAFLHCAQILVREGERVKQGQVIGTIGMSGRATGPHLHWSLKWHSARLDPLLFTGPMD